MNKLWHLQLCFSGREWCYPSSFVSVDGLSSKGWAFFHCTWSNWHFWYEGSEMSKVLMLCSCCFFTVSQSSGFIDPHSTNTTCPELIIWWWNFFSSGDLLFRLNLSVSFCLWRIHCATWRGSNWRAPAVRLSLQPGDVAQGILVRVEGYGCSQLRKSLRKHAFMPSRSKVYKTTFKTNIH